RTRVAAIDRVGVTHLEPVCGMQRTRAGKPHERLAGAVIGVDQERRRTLARAIFHWHQVRSVAHRGVAVGERRRLRVLRIVLAEDSAKELTERIVKRIEPDHRRIAKMTVVVPAPARREYEIARPHWHALAL